MAHEDKNFKKMEDFQDFADDNSSAPPALEEDLFDEEDFNFDIPEEELAKLQTSIMGQAEELDKNESPTEEVNSPEEENKENTPKENDIQENSEENSEENIEKNKENTTEEKKEEKQVDISPWEELDENNSVVKKYIFYISKDFVPYIDKLSTDERSAYVNDAIQIKIDIEDEKKQKEKKAKVVTHFVILILTFCLLSPVVLYFTHKAIMATFDNYKYSQEQFEKLYRERFANDKAYMRSVEYNKKLKAKNNSQAH